MLALSRHSSLSSIPSLSFLPRVTKLVPRQMSSMAISRLRQLHQQMGAAGSKPFSTDTTTSPSTSSHIGSGKSSSLSSLSSPQTETSKRIAERQPITPPVLFKSEFAARRFILNRPSALNALNYDMIKMIKEKVDVSFVFCPQFAMRIYKQSFNWLCETT